MSNLNALIEALPKAELHLHLEGSLEPEQLMEFAARNGVDIPFKTLEEVRAAYEFSNLQDFLDIYYQGMSVLQTEADFHDLTDAYLQRVAADNVRHVEVFFDPQGHTDRGIPFDVPIKGILRALDAAEAKYGITYRLIMCFLRHLSEEDAFETWEQAQPWLSKIHGIGLDSSENGHPPSKFTRIYEAARKAGLKLVAHAGEEGPPSYVYEALDDLKIDRIDHGNRSLEDDALVARIKEAGLTLTVCPLSNLSLCVVDDLKDHPMKRMLELGLKATINSDDPAYFGGYMNENYRQTAEAVGLTREEIITIAKNGFTGSFLSPEEQARHLAEIDRIASAH
ncbi:adenosine deaminase [Henriciella litoralis]|uniref:adenosine deaminase n=1 Tax=Henriciella litoralis TaxID=568102 RepID=UPI0009FD91BC|nr:adenosine deaminase [Henriciella litoralis]